MTGCLHSFVAMRSQSIMGGVCNRGNLFASCMGCEKQEESGVAQSPLRMSPMT